MQKISSGNLDRRLIKWILLISLLLACVLPTVNTPAVATPEFSNHIIVSLTDPQNGDAFPISAGLSIRGEAISDGSITRMELWADGVLYEDYPAPEDELGLLVHYWTWSPTTLGMHQLMVRAYNDQGQTAFSNVIHIEGIEDPGYILITKAEEGDTVAGIAGRYNVSIADLLRENPGLTDSASLSAGEEVFVNIGVAASVSTPTVTAKVLMKLNQTLMNGIQSDFIPPAILTAPTLTVAGQGCNATLSIGDLSDNEKGFNIYRLGPGAMSFSKLTTLPMHEDATALSHQDTNLFGLYHYYVAAFDDQGEAASNLVSLAITDSNCAGVPTTIDDLALIPMSVDQYYLYVAINNGPWRRFPADEFTFLKTSQGIDFNQVAASLAPNAAGTINMRGEVWGMVNGSAILLGDFEKSIKAAQAPAVFDASSSLYSSMQTILEVRGIFDVSAGKDSWYKQWGMQYDTHTFRFGTDAAATYGIWQVSSVPFQAEASFNPACLLLAGKANGSGTPGAPFQFGIDFSSLKPQIEAVQLSPFENSLNQTPVFDKPFSPQGVSSAPQETVTQPKWGAGAFGLGGGSPVFASFDPCAQNVSAEGILTYHVRIIPMSNGQATGIPSNTVIMNYDPSGDLKITFPAPPPIPLGTYYDVEILNFTGVYVPDLEYVYCVEIVKDDSLFPAYKPGDKVCPKPFTGGNKNGLLGAIEDAFNFISGIYNKLSDWATELVEQLNPLCIQAKLASSAIKVGEKEVKDACHYIAVIAVTAAKTYAGLPPSLPNFDQLTALGKENLVELAAQELENSGVPCPEECKNVIRKGIDYSLEQAKTNMSNSSCMGEKEANANGYQPLCLPPGVVSKPDPRGQPAPAVVEVKVTRRPNTTGPDFPEPTSCNATVNAYANNNVVNSYTTSAGFKWNGGAIEGNLLDGVGAFPNLKPGQSTTMPIILSPISFWLSGHQQFVQQGWKPEHFDDWSILYEGALATINAGGACKFEFPEGTGFSNNAVNGDSLQVGPLGGAWLQTCHPYNCP